MGRVGEHSYRRFVSTYGGALPGAEHAPSIGVASGAKRLSRIPRSTWLAVLALVAEAGLIELYLRHLLTRPFYYDEASRAYQLSIGGRIFGHLNALAAPLALGWVVLEDVFRTLFGDTEVGLRAPMFLTLPLVGVATYLLARRWLGNGVGFLLAAALVANSWSVNNALQLKSYTYEALFAVVAVWVFMRARESTHPKTTVAWYAALGLTCVFSLPNLFIVASLLAFDLTKSLRSRPVPMERVAGAGAAGVIALSHYLLFVRPASGVSDENFWNSNFPPGHGLTSMFSFIARGIESYFPSMVTGVAGATNQPPAYRLPGFAHEILAVVLALLLLAGIATAVRVRDGQVLVIAVLGSMMLELFGSMLHRWPFGLVRVNIFLLPFLYLLAGIGAVSIFRWMSAARTWSVGTTALRRWSFIGGVGVVSATLAVSGAAAGASTAHALSQTNAEQIQPTVFSGVSAAVDLSRRTALPSDIVIVQALRPRPAWYSYSWLYYMDSYQGYGAAVSPLSRIPDDNTLAVAYATPGTIYGFLGAHCCQDSVYLLELNGPRGVFSPAIQDLDSRGIHTIEQYGYRPVQQVYFPVTGMLTMFQWPRYALQRADADSDSFDPSASH